MATYCQNHVEEEVERLSKLGKVKETPTKEGMCGHLGGCNTDNLGLVKLECDYGIKQEAPETPADEATVDDNTTPEEATIPEEVAKGTTAEEKSVEA